MGKRILFATLGSLGDLHPLLAIGQGLRQRGHTVTIATSRIHRERIEACDISWALMRPDAPTDTLVLNRIFDALEGPEYTIRQVLAPAIRESYDDLDRAAEDIDLLISSSLAFAAPLVAAMRNIPWISVQFQSIGFLSSYEAPLPPQFLWIDQIPNLRRILGQPLCALTRAATLPWVKSLDEFRAHLGLPSGVHPLWEGQLSRAGILALFSGAYAPRQQDWPAGVVVTGFCFHDRPEIGSANITDELRVFLAAGPPPIVVTLGSAMIQVAKLFYAKMLEAVTALGQRAIFLVGNATNRATLPATLPEHILCTEYAPYAQVFPYASLVVHQGGIGTIAQSLRFGKPMVLVPFGYDQPDNALHAQRLGVAQIVRQEQITAVNLQNALTNVLSNIVMHATAQMLMQQLAQEDGVTVACNTIEKYLSR